MEISIANRQRRTGISPERVKLIARHVLERESASFDEISVVFVGPKSMRALNRDFTGRDEPTDTLAFELSPGRVGDRRISGKRLGDVIVCVESAAEQSRRYGVSFENELARLVIHGLLHLSGFRDGTGAERARMRRREKHYLDSLSGFISCLVPGSSGSRGSGRFKTGKG